MRIKILWIFLVTLATILYCFFNFHNHMILFSLLSSHFSHCSFSVSFSGSSSQSEQTRLCSSNKNYNGLTGQKCISGSCYISHTDWQRIPLPTVTGGARLREAPPSCSCAIGTHSQCSRHSRKRNPKNHLGAFLLLELGVTRGICTLCWPGQV